MRRPHGSVSRETPTAIRDDVSRETPTPTSSSHEEQYRVSRRRRLGYRADQLPSEERERWR
jgi:hypothetical protein